MVSLWPWKGNDNSPASFEKALSSLAGKITKSQARLDSLRQRSRRLKALWTLYAIFFYLLCAVILVLVVGYNNWGPIEYTGVSASPLVIYLVRQSLTSYYNYRIESVSQRLEDQQAERTKTIDKLKAATKYNSTQELLEKYEGVAPAPKSKTARAQSKTPKPKQNQKQNQRTGNGPPPTANIQRPGQNQLPSPRQPSTPEAVPFIAPPSHVVPSPMSLGAGPRPGPPEFAPNAFPVAPHYASGGEMSMGGHWYDRVLDLLMGEDETNPRNRMALICQNCRLVNGQAPPGTHGPADLGKWRCFGCGGWNGVEDEATKVVQEMKERIEQQHPLLENESSDDRAKDGGIDGQSDQKADSDIKIETDSEEEIVEVRPKRGRPKGSKKA
ncbi:hypothetical protein BJ875DRAFT_486632 [Amylocarpus encephaloides]|uniref:Endoplasmic reticulum junction formation protein lunapark n=1 Tax=Amylocarpus encephaloides TaxID=45428 RepID=A0A9P7YF13_9HELO|nr:hypothetical protein BJ875DRAFT_486632 [Amylocarpus encephaloides]